MRRNITQLAAPGPAAAVLSALTVTAAGAAVAATRLPQLPGCPAGVSQGLAAPGTCQWVSRYNGTGNGDGDAKSVAVSPDGSTVYTTCDGAGTRGQDCVTIAL